MFKEPPGTHPQNYEEVSTQTPLWSSPENTGFTAFQTDQSQGKHRFKEQGSCRASSGWNLGSPPSSLVRMAIRPWDRLDVAFKPLPALSPPRRLPPDSRALCGQQDSLCSKSPLSGSPL